MKRLPLLVKFLKYKFSINTAIREVQWKMRADS